ncbi:MAG: Chaperone protein DnaK [Candidatus Bipolaricaulis sibiricus]|uniref:Chaperone protein DnaK n=1 Tax=Bipolaricaulis sibiricus TaxID=2501609 RepID=A0A410FW99_BIPS1|nr:MAG: Chaperone protein DnaK [Candidatus Bipolaricaulis sibiricus]
MTDKEKIIGIDLGTTFSCGALVRGGRPEVLLNAEGERITPSAVAFTDSGEVLVGQLARRQAVLNPTRTVLSVKRKMGTDWRIKVTAGGRTEEYTPEQISAFILQKIKRDAEELLGTKITKAVITVPAYFNNLQRQATKDAGKIAGLEVLRIINEPTAAALAYGLDKNKEQKILVYDLGGGTFDVSILDIGEGVFEVVASDGDTQLGGDDFDRRIVEWLVAEFKADTGMDVRNDPQAMQRLRDAAEAAKKELSSRMEARISLPYLSADAKGPKHLERTLTRSKFEAMISDYLEKTMRIVDAALQAAKLGDKDIEQVVLVGGSTRIPKVQELVAAKFGKAKVNKDINPDEVVALGAAIQAAVLAGDMQSLVLLDVTPLTLSIETLGGVATPLIERNTTIPVEKTKTFTTADDFQTQVEIHVVQGERKMAADNKSLGRFQLTDLPPAPRGVPQIDVTFQIDADGILNVTAKDKATGKSASIEIRETSRLTEAEIERMRKDAEEHAEEDRRRVEEVETRNQADALVHTVEKTVGELGDKVPAAKRGEIEAAIRSLREKLDSRADVGAIRAGMEELKRLAGEVATAAYQAAGQTTRTDTGQPGTGDYIPYDKEDKE